MEMGIETELQTGNGNGDGATDWNGNGNGDRATGSLRMETELQTEASALQYWATVLRSLSSHPLVL